MIDSGEAGANRGMKYKPVLSLAAYRRRSDKIELPETVLSLRDDYQITLNTFAEHEPYCF